MQEKFNLAQLLKEISEETEEQNSKKSKVSQDDIKQMLAKRKKGEKK